MKPLKPHIPPVLAVLSLILALSTAVLWIRSYRAGSPDQISWLPFDTRYILRSHRGSLVQGAPPSASPNKNREADELAKKLADARISFVPVVRGRDNQVEGFCLPPLGVSVAATQLAASGQPAVDHALLRALEDPERFAAAHTLLASRARTARCNVQLRGRRIFVVYDGLEAELRPELRDSDYHTVVDEKGVAHSLLVFCKTYAGDEHVYVNPAQIPRLVRQWHDRLDVTVMSVPHAVPLAIFLILPSRWCWRWWRRRTALRRGLCPHCRYDLRASKDICPECGQPIERQSTSIPSPGILSGGGQAGDQNPPNC